MIAFMFPEVGYKYINPSKLDPVLKCELTEKRELRISTDNGIQCL